MQITEPWREALTEQQRKILNAACGDLAAQISWHGFRLSKDDWRHLISGTMLGWRLMPGIDRGEGQAGLIMLGGSSLDLSKEQCIDAITQAFAIGDDPSSQGLKSPPVRWCAAVVKARWLVQEDVAA
ncbi:MAG: recombination protein NinB [Burkholderiales bacterium]